MDLSDLEHWTPECDWPGCDDEVHDGKAFCSFHRENQTIRYRRGDA